MGSRSVFQWYTNIRWYSNIAILAFLGTCPIILGFYLWLLPYLKNTLILLLPFVIALIVTFRTELRRREKDFLSQQEYQHRLYIDKTLRAGEQERQRLAQELHDDTIQNLLAIASFAKALESDAKDDTAKTRAALIRDVSLTSAEELRRIVHALKPRILDDLGLVPALNWLVSSINESMSVRVKMFIDGIERNLGSREDLILFRIVQEALNNVKTHANATEAVINLEYLNGGLTLSVRDNGRGFNIDTVMRYLPLSGKMGLVGIRERVESLGGTMEIRSNLGEGTVILINLKY